MTRYLSGGYRTGMLRRLIAVAGTAAVLAAAVPGAAVAQPDGAASGRDFGQHVASCAREMGFGGAHNPGVHRGFAGWHGHACPG